MRRAAAERLVRLERWVRLARWDLMVTRVHRARQVMREIRDQAG